MIPSSLNTNELDSFRYANSLLKETNKPSFGLSFEEVLEKKAKEEIQKVKDKATDIAENTTNKKSKKTNDHDNDLPNITKAFQNADRRTLGSLENTYSLLEKFKERKKLQEEEPGNSPRKRALTNSHNFAGQPLIQPIQDYSGRRKMSRSKMLETWEKFAPFVTEDATKKSVRLDIPLLNDVQALVLKLNPDRSISASMLGSKIMGDLVKQNKEKLNKNLKHHHLSLKEFNTFTTQIAFNSEAGPRKKRKKQANKKKDIDLI